MIKFTKYKIIITAVFGLLFANTVFSQNIELPEVTTVVSGENVAAKDDALPSFSDVTIIPQKSEKGGIVLPEMTVSSGELENQDIQDISQKNIFAEGLIGGGFPTLFTGEFSVFRTVTDSPFKVNFLYDSAVGYANHNLTDSFSDQTIDLSIEKGFTKNNYSWDFSGGYDSLSNGLQNLAQNVDDKITKINLDKYFGDVNFTYSFPHNISLGGNLNADFYNRYADTLQNSFPSIEIFSVSPSFYAKWENYGFQTNFTADYLFETGFQNKISNGAKNRAQFDLEVDWSKNIVKTYAKVSAVLGNQLNDNVVLVPFMVGADFSFPVYFSNRNFSISAQGGLESFGNKISDLEEKFKFSSINIMPSETSFWYGKAGFSVPLKDSFTGSAEFEYKQTAFSNGVWQPVYETSYLNNGLYDFLCKDMTVFSSKVELAYHYKIFSIVAGWKSNWLDVPVLENTHQIYLNVNFQSENTKWGTDMKVIQPLEYDYIDPIINIEGFVKLTQAVRAVVSVQDIVKLCKGEPRIYCGEYYGRGGTATILLKFFF